MVKNILITGGCGFIGLNLIEKLTACTKNNFNIRVLDNLSVGTKDELDSIKTFKVITSSKCDLNKNKFELVVGDIKEIKVCEEATKGIDSIIHLAANTGVQPSINNPHEDFQNNVIGTFNLLLMAKMHKINKFVFASSGAPIGECTPPIHEEMPTHPLSPYGSSKLCGEAYCSSFFNSYGIDSVSLRFGNVYGPKSFKKESVVAKFIKKAISGDSLEIYGDGSQTRDFIYVGDLVDAIIAAENKKNIGGNVFQIATNQETSINYIIVLLTKILNDFGTTNFDAIKTNPKTGDVLRNFSNIDKAKNVLGWKPLVGLEQGLRETVRSFLAKEKYLL